jgi:DNA-binding transcriptional MerR regulator
VDELSIGEFSQRSHLSVKALRLYDEIGVLLPARVDRASGYRFYDTTQLKNARLISMLRQLGFPLSDIKEMLRYDPVEMSRRIAQQWQHTEAEHDKRRELAHLLINQLSGKKTNMLEVSTREIPERTLLCLKRTVDPQSAWKLGKEFIAIMHERPLPKMEGRESAAFSIYWSEVSADSDGPVEWCKPIPKDQADRLAPQYPELHLRTEPAHREAFVPITAGSEDSGVSVQLASEALRAWAAEQFLKSERLIISPEELGARITYGWAEPRTETGGPNCDFAIAFALANESS